jgi:hypothetical protein
MRRDDERPEDHRVGWGRMGIEDGREEKRGN